MRCPESALHKICQIEVSAYRLVGKKQEGTLMFQRQIIASVLIALSASIGGNCALSQESRFPSRMIRVVVPFAPGGGVDTLARMVSERIETRLGVKVIVENRSGANGTVGGT